MLEIITSTAFGIAMLLAAIGVLAACSDGPGPDAAA